MAPFGYTAHREGGSDVHNPGSGSGAGPLAALSVHERTVSSNLDDEFTCLLLDIERKYEGLQKYLRIRVERWVQKLSEVGSVKTEWKRNRNHYA